MIAIGKFKDLTGQRFGKLTVIKRVENNDRNKVRWLCQCDCGNTHITISYNLTHGLCQSCGCLQQEIIETNRQRIYNTYDLSGTYGIGYTSKGEEFYFDLEDYDKIKNYCWYINCDGYVVTTINETHSKIKMHRIVMNILDSPKILVDHIYHNRNDNRRENLRIVTDKENCENRKITNRNISGVVGVSWSKAHNKWIAHIRYKNKKIVLGHFKIFEDAVNARKQAEKELFEEIPNVSAINKE